MRFVSMLALLLAAFTAAAQTPAASQPTTVATAAQRDTSYIDAKGTAHITRIVPVPDDLSPQAQRMLAHPEPEAAPHGNWKILTILGAMSTRGMIATMTIEEATDADIFLAYLDEVLSPAVRPGDVVVMDNLSAHKVQGVQRRIEAAGAEWLYLPPCSPDLNPIEKAWSKLKQMLRQTRARTKEALDQASTELLPQITPDKDQAWFRLRLSTIL